MIGYDLIQTILESTTDNYINESFNDIINENNDIVLYTQAYSDIMDESVYEPYYEELNEAATGVFEKIKGFFQNLIKLVKSIISKIGGQFKKMIESVKNLFNKNGSKAAKKIKEGKIIAADRNILEQIRKASQEIDKTIKTSKNTEEDLKRDQELIKKANEAIDKVLEAQGKDSDDEPVVILDIEDTIMEDLNYNIIDITKENEKSANDKPKTKPVRAMTTHIWDENKTIGLLEDLVEINTRCNDCYLYTLETCFIGIDVKSEDDKKWLFTLNDEVIDSNSLSKLNARYNADTTSARLGLKSCKMMGNDNKFLNFKVSDLYKDGEVELTDSIISNISKNIEDIKFNAPSEIIYNQIIAYNKRNIEKIDKWKEYSEHKPENMDIFVNYLSVITNYCNEIISYMNFTYKKYAEIAGSYMNDMAKLIDFASK